MRILNFLILATLAAAVISGAAAAQQATTGTTMAGTPATGTAQTFTLGGNTAYTINAINKIDAWRMLEMGIPAVSLPAGATAHIVYSTGVPSSIGSNTDMARMVVFGPGGFVSAGSWPGTGGSLQSYSFTGGADQYFLVTQQSGGTKDRVIVSFG